MQVFSTEKVELLNNEMSPGGFDPSKSRHYLIPTDVNALYSSGLLGKYPVDKFRWLEEEEFNSMDWSDPNLGNDSSTGYILRVDVYNPHSIHDSTEQLPFLPQKSRIPFEELGKGQQERLNRHGIRKTFLSQPKMILDQGNKKITVYIIDISNTYRHSA